MTCQPQPIAIVALFATMISAPAVHAQQPSEPVVVTYGGGNDFVLHEPVIATLTVENRLQEPVQFDLGQYRKSNIKIVMRTPDGSSESLQPPVESNVGLIGRVSLGPGQIYSQQLLLNEWHSFDVVGEYEVDIRLDSSFQTKAGRVLSPGTTATLTYRISPKDEGRLRRTCEGLAHVAVASTSVQAQLDAARALSYIADSAVIPSLQEVLRATTKLDPILVEGLRRIGTTEAKALLVDLSASSDRERAALARNALQRS